MTVLKSTVGLIIKDFGECLIIGTIFIGNCKNDFLELSLEFRFQQSLENCCNLGWVLTEDAAAICAENQYIEVVFGSNTKNEVNAAV